MRLKRIMIAAPKSGSGKTMLTCALLTALKNRGQRAVSFKCGPDYIDPMFHEKVIGIPSKNLDTFFAGEELTLELFLKDRTESDFVVIEGVMGMFDGLGGVREEGSSYHLAKVTKTPIILVADVKGMGWSVLPLIAGFLAYDKEKLMKGVILNKISEAYYKTLKPLIEDELKIKVLGSFPFNEHVGIKSRHLGLVMPNELVDIKRVLGDLSTEFEKTVDIDEIGNIAGRSEELFLPVGDGKSRVVKGSFKAGENPVVAVAKDEAFCFYYEDNLDMIRQNGAKIKYFSPIHDEKLPEGCSAILIGGGYPERYLNELSENISMRSAVKQAFDDGMPVVAECGGFMYLNHAIVDKDGVSHEMAGIVRAECCYQGKSVRFGYIEIREKESHFLHGKETIKGHEFHYFDSTDNGESCIARKPLNGREYSCIMAGENYWLGFPHLYYPSNPSFAESFVKKACKYKERKGI